MEEKKKRTFLGKMKFYASFLWNLVPSPRFIKSTLDRVKNKIANDCYKIVNYVVRASSAFLGYKIRTPFSKAEQCPTDEKPLIIKIDSKGGTHHMHGAAQYDGVAVDSDGEEKNTTTTGNVRPSDEELNGTYFVLYPSKLGINPMALKKAMKQEAAKTNDYDYYDNNCIDHILRPLQAAGVQVDKGWISTPREMCQWCDKMCQNGYGYVLNEKEYKKLIVKSVPSKGDLRNYLTKSQENFKSGENQLRNRIARSSQKRIIRGYSNAA